MRDITSFYLKILNEGLDIVDINNTHIALVPKIKDPLHMS